MIYLSDLSLRGQSITVLFRGTREHFISLCCSWCWDCWFFKKCLGELIFCTCIVLYKKKFCSTTVYNLLKYNQWQHIYKPNNTEDDSGKIYIISISLATSSISVLISPFLNVCSTIILYKVDRFGLCFYSKRFIPTSSAVPYKFSE